MTDTDAGGEKGLRRAGLFLRDLDRQLDESAVTARDGPAGSGRPEHGSVNQCSAPPSRDQVMVSVVDRGVVVGRIAFLARGDVDVAVLVNGGAAGAVREVTSGNTCVVHSGARFVGAEVVHHPTSRVEEQDLPGVVVGGHQPTLCVDAAEVLVAEQVRVGLRWSSVPPELAAIA